MPLRVISTLRFAAIAVLLAVAAVAAGDGASAGGPNDLGGQKTAPATDGGGPSDRSLTWGASATAERADALALQAYAPMKGGQQQLDGPWKVDARALPEPETKDPPAEEETRPWLAPQIPERPWPVAVANAVEETPEVEPSTTINPAIGLTFDGLDSADNPSPLTPPDPQIAAGPSHVVEFVNVVGRISDKTGTPISTFDLDSFFLVPLDAFGFDPKIIYDDLHDRFFASYVSIQGSTNTGFLHLGVSDTSDPTGTWSMYAVGYAGVFPDYAAIGVTSDKLTTSYNIFDNITSDYIGEQTVVVQKSDMLAGTAPASGSFFPIDPDRFTVRPAHHLSAGDDQYLTTFDISSGTPTTDMTVIRITGTPDAGNVTEAAADNVTVLAQSTPPLSSTAGPGFIDSGDFRMLEAVWRNGSLWSSASDACLVGGELQSCVHLIEVYTATTPTPTVDQDILFGATGEDFSWPAIRTDGSANLHVSMAAAHPGMFASAKVTGRAASDPPNTMGDVCMLKEGEVVHTSGRWGDYMGVAVDPSDPSTVWHVGEYAKDDGVRQWGTYIGTTSFTTPGTCPAQPPVPPPPANDDKADATVIPGPLPYTDSSVNTATATVEPGEPLPCGSIGSTVWYEFTPSSSTTLVADTFGSSYDTVLAVYEGTPGVLPTLGDLVGCNDQTGGNQSRVVFPATAGQTYQFQAGGFLGQGGALTFNLQEVGTVTCPTSPTFSWSVTDPTGDAFGAGTPNHDITNVTGEGDGGAFCLTVDFDGPVDPADAGSGDEVGGWIDFDTDSNSSTGLTPAVNFFCPSLADMGVDRELDLFSVAGGFGSLDTTIVEVEFDTTSFTAKIPLDAISGDSSFDVSMIVGSSLEPTDCAPNGGCIQSPAGTLGCGPPSNDDKVDATVIPEPLPYTDDSVNTLLASDEPGEPAPCGLIGNTVWYEFTPSTSATLNADTFGSGYDTVLALYTGTPGVLPNIGDLIDCDDDTVGVLSWTSFNATAGVTYQFQVGGFNGASGPLTLHLYDPIPGDIDGDGHWNDDEALKGSAPANPGSTPEHCDGFDNDADTVVDEVPAGANWDIDGDTLLDCFDGDVDTDGDGSFNTLDDDDDGDGRTDAQEQSLTTDELAPCPTSSSHDAWPSDRSRDGDADVGDVLANFVGKILSSTNYDARSDADGDGDVDVGDLIALYFEEILTACTELTFSNTTGGIVDDIHIEWGGVVEEVFLSRDSDFVGWSERTLSGDGLTLDLARPDVLGDLGPGGVLTIVVRGAPVTPTSCQWTLDDIDQGAC